MDYARPIVLVSSCLEFERVRFDGQVIPCRIVRELEPFVEYVKVCPEFSIGLGVPRPPIRIVKKGGEERLVQPKTGEDLTDKMNSFSRDFLEKLGKIDGAIFKSDSPSVGIREIKVYKDAEKSPVVDKTCGFFSRHVVKKFKFYPIEDEKRLINPKIRHHFLTSLFTLASHRSCREKNSLDELFRKNQWLLRLYGADRVEEEEKMRIAFRKPPGVDKKAQVLGKMAAKLGMGKEFDDVIEKYVKNRVDFSCVLEIIFFEAKKTLPKLAEQSIFRPYPKELIPEAEADRNRDYYKSIR
jgi:uncharacterized protein YbbK (DUF523 family)